jgi:peroxiredoxin
MGQSREPNTPAIDFTLPDGDGKPVTLSALRGRSVVLAFYPADWSPVCTSELSLIQETIEDIRGHDADVLGISVDGSYCHRAWAAHQHLTFPLLSDFWPHGAVCRQYGVFRENDGVSARALFFIDASGLLRQSWIASDPDVAPGLNVIFDALGRIVGTGGQEAAHV